MSSVPSRRARALIRAALAVLLAAGAAAPLRALAQGGQPQTQPAQRVNPDAFELSFWETIKNSRNPEDFKAYLDTFPNGHFAPLARIRLRDAGGGAQPADTAPGSTRPMDPGGAATLEPLDGTFTATAGTPVLAGPAANAARIGALKKGDTVRVVGRVAGGSHYRILTSDGRTAYVQADRLKAAEAAPADPAPPPPPPPSGDTVVQGRPGEPVVDCADCPEMVAIPPGAFDMGANELFEFEKPVHRVTIGRGLLIGRREVTVKEWQLCISEGGCPAGSGGGGGDVNLPASDVSWTEAKGYADWLSRKTGKRYRLPTEAEWEYAARAGTRTTYFWGAALLRERANCAGCNATPLRRAVSVGSFAPNDFGLYDMAGNVAEWVEDCWTENYKGAPADGSARAAPTCRERVLRGGSFVNDPRYLRSAARFKYDAEVRYYANGLRVARDP
ncbi:SUMF1/EgtB/PvdO family nonheme iron enzyme [Prosthecomicrobium sp. N25]|uniref:SUMF1/EgtB/PvdO family nonheme iron enzyme n=1 Tax=Prosthecomicrobium sp. N25 TaxID=3129254 RepID=UPI003076B547